MSISSARSAQRATAVERADGDDSQPRLAPRSVPRSAARCRASKAATRSPAAPNTRTPCGCRACCTPRFSAAPWRTAGSSRSTPARRGRLPGVLHVVTIDDVMKVLPDPYYGPAFHDQPILAHREGALRRRAGGGRDRHRPACRRAGGATHHRRIRGIAGGLRRGRGVDQRHLRARPAQAGRRLRRPQAPQGRQEHQYRADYRLRRGDFDTAYRRRRAQVRA